VAVGKIVVATLQQWQQLGKGVDSALPFGGPSDQLWQQPLLSSGLTHKKFIQHSSTTPALDQREDNVACM
jgi:hypothetical protein